MRKLLLIVSLVLGLLLTACDRSSELRSCPTPESGTPIALPTAQPIADADVTATVWNGARIIESNYVDKLKRLDLLEAAWQATADELNKRGVTIPTDIDPNHARAPQAGERQNQLRTAFDKVLGASDGKLSAQQIVDISLTAIAASLHDAHTSFVPARIWSDQSNRRVTSSGFRGAPYANGLLLTDVLEGSPAELAGLKPGDLLTTVNGQPYGSPRANSGSPGGAAILKFSRAGTPDFEVSLQAQATRVPLQTHDLLDGQVGLVRLYDFPFTDDCDYVGDFQNALDGAISDLKAKGASAWIFDLRNNPGGALLSASALAATLGYDGPLLETRRKSDHSAIETTGTALLAGAPLAILMNEGSASSSEVVASVLQESGRAQVVGTNSAGEVEASRPFPIAGGALRVTIGRIGVGPAHRSLQGGGVQPDTEVALDLDLLFRAGRDSQVEAAVAYLKGKLR